ncbi:MAG: hypothetical protein HYU64_16305 [Armatimonadetes bacterium]|nr:hypothetical protein [Armatimonadota bacterium]
MKIIAFIQQDEPVKKILKHLNLWDYPGRAPPRKVSVPVQQVLFPRKNEKQALHYQTGDEYDAHRSCALMAADSWEGYYSYQDTPIEHFCIDPEPEYD